MLSNSIQISIYLLNMRVCVCVVKINQDFFKPKMELIKMNHVPWTRVLNILIRIEQRDLLKPKKCLSVLYRSDFYDSSHFNLAYD